MHFLVDKPLYPSSDGALLSWEERLADISAVTILLCIPVSPLGEKGP
jgi:hypothetical protein